MPMLMDLYRAILGDYLRHGGPFGMEAPHFVCWLLFSLQLNQGQHEPYGSLHGAIGH